MNKKEIYELINGYDIGMMTNVNEDGKLVSHPMARQGKVTENILWFFTDKHSEKITELKKDNQVNLAFQSDEYISVSGRVEMVDDFDRKEELWSEELNAFYEGPENDQVILLKVNIDSIEYWTAENPVKSAFEFVKGMVSDEEAELGKHDAINL